MFVSVVVLVVLIEVLWMAQASTWTDWDKRQSCHPTKGFVQPSSIDDVISIVKMASSSQQQVKVIGSGHSFSPVRSQAIVVFTSILNE